MDGQNTPQITVNWGIFGGDIEAEITTNDGPVLINYPVKVSHNYLQNPGFEKGVKSWNKAGNYPGANFFLTGNNVHHGENALNVEVSQPGTNAWDIQLSQSNLELLDGTGYHLSFWAKAEAAQGQISASIINSSNYDLMAAHSFSPHETWSLFEFDFTAPSSVDAALNIDMGDHTGHYYFDDFTLTTSALTDMNKLKNPDFFDGGYEWNLITNSAAEATGGVEDGIYSLSIVNGGADAWDIHFGQTGLWIENGKTYIISFDAYADNPGQISAFVGKDAEPWNTYSGTQPISLTTTMKTYTYSFTMNEQTDPQSRFGFDLGGNVNNIFFDNLALYEGGAVNQVSIPNANNTPSYHALRNHPNPFQGQTTIFYLLDEPAEVTLQVLNLNGQVIETLVKEFQPGRRASGFMESKRTTTRDLFLTATDRQKS